jgi:site-specific DNA-methyltransferase (adenine-specific)
MVDQGCDSLDDILCDPVLARQFDAQAARWAPNFTPLEYRWAALKLRKKAKEASREASLLRDASLSKPVTLDRSGFRQLPQSPGIYVVLGSKERVLYAGETKDLHGRLESTRALWKNYSRTLAARYFLTACSFGKRLAYQRRLVYQHRPMLNLVDRELHEGRITAGV